MGAADAMLFGLLGVAEVCLMVYLHRRRKRRFRAECMMRSLRRSIQRDIRATTPA